MATVESTIYCLRCKRQTANAQPPELATTANGQATLRAQCKECGGNKSQFASKPK